MGAVAKFLGFGAGVFAFGALLKSMDRLLYSLDETRPQRIAEHQIRMKAIAAQRELLAAPKGED